MSTTAQLLAATLNGGDLHCWIGRPVPSGAVAWPERRVIDAAAAHLVATYCPRAPSLTEPGRPLWLPRGDCVRWAIPTPPFLLADDADPALMLHTVTLQCYGWPDWPDVWAGYDRTDQTWYTAEVVVQGEARP